MVLMGYSEAGGKLIHEKTRSKKSRDTVPLKEVSHLIHLGHEKVYSRTGGKRGKNRRDQRRKEYREKGKG
jgi:hypothetical protein